MPNDRDPIEAVYREGARELPPEDIDRAITAAARTALKPWYQRRGPLTGLSTAAALLLAAALVSLQYLPEPQAPRTEAPEAAVGFEDRTDPLPAADAVSDDAGPAEARREAVAETSPPAAAYRKASAAETTSARAAVRQPEALAPATRLQSDRAAQEATGSVPDRNEFAGIGSQTPGDARGCDPSPHFDGRAYELLPADEGPLRIRSEGRQWQCRDGLWIAADELEAAADADTPAPQSRPAAVPSEQQ